MATQTQRVVRLDGANQIVEIIDGGSSAVPDPTPTTNGGVKLGAALANPAELTATADTASAATDVAGLLVDHNDLVTKYNALLADTTVLRTTITSLLTQLKAKTIPT